MGRPRLQLKNYSSDSILSIMKSSKDYVVGIRLLAVYQISLGKSPRELEDIFQTSFKQITTWVHRFDEEGVEGLKDKPGKGRKSKLSDEQFDRVKQLLLNESPEQYGYNTATWTGPLVKEWIKENLGVEYKDAQIYNILHRLGFSYQKGRGVYPEADPKKQEQFKQDFKKN